MAMLNKVLLVFILLTITRVYTRAVRLKIGVILEKNSLHKHILNFIIESLNDKHRTDLWLKVFLEQIQSSPVEETDQKVCSLLQHGVVSIFGPINRQSNARIESVCTKAQVPLIQILPQLQTDKKSLFSVNLHPPLRNIGQAIADVIVHFGWKSFVLLYEQPQDLIWLQDIVVLSSLKERITVRVRQLPFDGEYRSFLKHLKRKYQESRFVVHCNVNLIESFVNQVTELRMTIHHYSYIFTNLDLLTLNIKRYDSQCNITGLSLFDWQSPAVQKLNWNLKTYFRSKNALSLIPKRGMESFVPIMYDAMSLLIETLRRPIACFPDYCEALKDSLQTRPLICDANDTWAYGRALLSSLKKTKFRGVTGPVEFDNEGRRKNGLLSVVENTKFGFEELAIWRQGAGLTLKNVNRKVPLVTETLENKTLRVVVHLEEPFVMYKHDSHLYFGNAKFEGYSIDLLAWIAEHNKFSYEIHEVQDGQYGAKDKHGKWNGMVGELVNEEADLAVSSMTISYSRSEVIEFTVPFMHLGISILFKRPRKEEGPELFNFLRPLSFGLWLYLLVGYLTVSFFMWFLARFSPFEWYNPHPQDKRRDSAGNQFTILNSLWFSVGSLMQQGSDVSPKAFSTRIIAAVWWFFTVILISSYTAKLAAFLTVARMTTPIESAEDLARQEKVKYGTLSQGSTMTFFKESRIPTYERMWVFMESSSPTVFVNNSKEGIARVKAGNYAYLMESTMLEYYAERDCDLIQIGGLIDSKGYGIALRKGSKFRKKISQTILMLQESTQLESLKDKWWRIKRGGGKCKNYRSNDKPIEGARKLRNIGGIFLILFCALLMALLIAFLEFVYKMRTDPALAKLSLCTAIMNEIGHLIRSCKDLAYFDHSGRRQVRRPLIITEYGGNIKEKRQRKGLGTRNLDEPFLSEEHVCLTNVKARDSELI